MIISGTVMILMTIVIRKLAMDRISKLIFVLIWGMVAIRLLIPFSIPLPFNIWNIINRADIPAEQTRDISNSVSPSVNSVNELVPVATLPLESQPTIMTVQPESNNNLLMNVIIGIWIAGILISIVYFLADHYKFRRKVGDSLPVENEFVRTWLEENKLIRPLQVRQTHKISSPLTYGILHPVILVPKVIDWQDVRQLNYIFTHEYIHIRRFDYATKILFAFTLCIHWFNPFVWAMYRLSNRDIELACDEAVLQRFGYKSKKSYALTLLNMEEKRNQYSLLNNNFSKNSLEERIQVMIKMKRKSIFTTTLALILILGTMTVFAASGENNTSSITPIMEGSNGDNEKNNVLSESDVAQTDKVEEQQRIWNSISNVIEETSSENELGPHSRDDGQGNITLMLPDENEEVIWYFADEDGELIEDEMYEKIIAYGWTGTFLGAEPWINEEGNVGIKTRWENLSYNTAISELSELGALHSSSYETLIAWLDDGGLERLEDSFTTVEISRIGGDGQSLSQEEARDMNFTFWSFNYSWGGTVEDSGIHIVLDYRNTTNFAND